MSQSKRKIALKKARKTNRWPLLLAITGIGLILLAAWAIWSSNNRPKAAIEVAGAPHIKVDQEKMDYGNQKLGNTVRAVVTVTNVGDKPLRFTKEPYIEVKEGC